VGGLVAVVIGLEFLVSGMKRFANLFLRENRVIELDLGVLFLELLANFFVGDGGTSGDEIDQLALKDVVFHALLEDGDGQVIAGEQVSVGFFSYKSAIREEGGGIAAMLEFVANIFVGSFETEALGLCDKGFAGDKAFSGLGGEEGNQLTRHGGVLAELLLHHRLRLL